MERVFGSLPFKYITFTHSVYVCAFPWMLSTRLNRDSHGLVEGCSWGSPTCSTRVNLVDYVVPTRGLATGWRFEGRLFTSRHRDMKLAH